MTNVVVLGTGMAGFGAAHHLQESGIRPLVFDQNAWFGGHTASFRDDLGFLFDQGPHISFTKDERIQKLFAGFVEDRFESVQVGLNNYWKGLWLTHPVQLHLNELPKDLIVEIIADFVREHSSLEHRPANYEQWLVTSYGRRFAELFPMQYTRKYHLTDASNMSTDWLGPRMYRPSLEELLRGALAPWKPETHYITNFRYPTQGGFVAYQRSFPDFADLQLNHEVASIDPKGRTIAFSNGKQAGFDQLVSSIALPDLIPMIRNAPRDVVEAARQLSCSTCVLVNIGVNRPDISAAHVSYVYDEDICFTRLSFPHLLSSTNAPVGCGSVQAEHYFSDRYRPLTESNEVLIDRTIADLVRMGVLRADDKIVTRHTTHVRHANVIFDLQRAAAVDIVHGFLKDVGIHYCGRYGDWGYMWTDESFISGERAAAAALS